MKLDMYGSKDVRWYFVNIISEVLTYDSNIVNIRILAEEAQTILNYYKFLKQNQLKINIDMIDIITKSFSKFFIPDLLKLSVEEYYILYESLYNMLTIPLKKEKSKILDLGCGVAHFEHYLSNNFKKINSVYAIDSNTEVIEINKQLYNELNYVEFHKSSIDDFDNTFFSEFDYVYATHIFRHLSSSVLKKFLKEVLSSTNSTFIFNDYPWMMNNIVKEYKEKIKNYKLYGSMLVIQC